MKVKYTGLSEINGPLVVINKVKDVFYDEIVKFSVNGEERKGKVVEVYENKAVIQVFGGTDSMSAVNTETEFAGETLKIPLSKEILGRVFNGAGNPIDGLGDVFPDEYRDINGMPMNPVAREYPENYINTGISAIDVMATLIRGQKLPIFSGNGMPHDNLAAQIVKQAKIGDKDNFAVVFAAMGVKHDVASFFRKTFEESGVLQNVVMFLNLANDPVVERIITPK